MSGRKERQLAGIQPKMRLDLPPGGFLRPDGSPAAESSAEEASSGCPLTASGSAALLSERRQRGVTSGYIWEHQQWCHWHRSARDGLLNHSGNLLKNVSQKVCYRDAKANDSKREDALIFLPSSRMTRVVIRLCSASYTLYWLWTRSVCCYVSLSYREKQTLGRKKQQLLTYIVCWIFTILKTKERKWVTCISWGGRLQRDIRHLLRRH